MTKEEKKALALKASKTTGSNVIYVNGKGECFTSNNLANLSDKKDNIDSFDFSKADEEKPVKPVKPVKPTE